MELKKLVEQENIENTYQIVNVLTGVYTAQLNDTDRLEIVNTNEKGTRGSQVNIYAFNLHT